MDLLLGLKVLIKDFRLRLEINDLERNWKELYPTLKIREQLILANNWCIANPTKAPRSQMIRFLNSWMKTASQWNEKIPKHKIYKEDKPAEEEVLTGEDWAKLREAIRK